MDPDALFCEVDNPTAVSPAMSATFRGTRFVTVPLNRTAAKNLK
jgi:hypothetical protein